MQKDIYFNLFKKINKNAKIAIFGTNNTAKNIFDKIQELRKDITVEFFLSSCEDGAFLELPIYNIYFANKKLEEIDCVIVASYSYRHLLKEILKIKKVKKIICINKDFIDIEKKQQKKLFDFENNNIGFELTLFGKTFEYVNSNKNKENAIKALIKEQQQTIKQKDSLKLILNTCDISACKKLDGNFSVFQKTRYLGFKYIKTILEKHNIEYWADFGTLLGAYRHKGMIPWDDDIDIAMNRENYDKAYKALKEALKDTCLEAHIGKYNLSTLIRISHKESEISLFDIFPYEFSDNKELSIEELSKKISACRNEFFNKYPRDDFLSRKYLMEDKMEEVYEIYKKHGISVTSKNQGQWLFRGIDSMSKNKVVTCHTKKSIYPLQKIQYEDMMINAPADIETYLKHADSGAYGDFMAFPDSKHLMVHQNYKRLNDKNTLSKIKKMHDDICALLKM